jgi:hypothetical protein
VVTAYVPIVYSIGFQTDVSHVPKNGAFTWRNQCVVGIAVQVDDATTVLNATTILAMRPWRATPRQYWDLKG